MHKTSLGITGQRRLFAGIGIVLKVDNSLANLLFQDVTFGDKRLQMLQLYNETKVV